MRLSQGFWQTLKETPSDADIVSQQLMMRAGLMYKTGAGLYTYLPMAFKSLKKIEYCSQSVGGCIGQVTISGTPV